MKTSQFWVLVILATVAFIAFLYFHKPTQILVIVNNNVGDLYQDESTNIDTISGTGNAIGNNNPIQNHTIPDNVPA